MQGKESPKILVLGIGNLLLSDEGIGVHAVRAIQSMVLPPNVKTLDGETAGFHLLPHIQGAERVVVIDCLDASAAPGTLFRVTPGDLAAGTGTKPISFHQVGLPGVLQLAAQLGKHPDEVVIIGVQPASVGPGLDLTPDVARRLPDIVQMVLAELHTTKDVQPGQDPQVLPEHTR